MSYVEPYSFKDKFTMPKYIINAGSDEFFSTDSWRFYYEELPNNKLIRYVPNANHSLSGEYLTNDLISFFYRIVNNIDLPILEWELVDGNLDVYLDYDGEYSVSIWKAFNQDGRDFRLLQEGELWTKSDMKKNEDNRYNIKLEINNTGYQAIMVEFTLDQDSDFPLKISTGPYVLPNSYPYEKYEPLK
jgi:PhoPQ-activated pathogenicity-related protein